MQTSSSTMGQERFDTGYDNSTSSIKEISFSSVGSPVDDSFKMDNGWEEAGDSNSSKQDDLKTVLEKEKVIKDIASTQEGLKALLDRINEVTDEIKKYSEENAMLQVYLDNMTRNTAMLAAAGRGDKK